MIFIQSCLTLGDTMGQVSLSAFSDLALLLELFYVLAVSALMVRKIILRDKSRNYSLNLKFT